MSNLKSVGPARFPLMPFPPWVGEHYGAAGDQVRIIVLGESNYGDPCRYDEEATRTLASRVITEHVSGQTPHRFVKNVTCGILGSKADKATINEFWAGAAYFNYVEGFVGSVPGDRPSKLQWGTGPERFRTVVSELRADLVIVCGKAIWGHLKDASRSAGYKVGYREVIDPLTWCRTFDAEGFETMAGMIHHPSRVFRCSQVHPRIQCYIERAMEWRDNPAGMRLRSQPE